MRVIIFCISIAFSISSLANYQELPKPWYQSNLEDFKSGILTDSDDHKYVGILKSRHTNSNFGSVLQHSAPRQEWLGKRIKLSAKIKTVKASAAVMFMTINHDNSESTSDFMSERKIRGTTEWTEYSIVLVYIIKLN